MLSIKFTHELNIKTQIKKKKTQKQWMNKNQF